MSSTLSGRQHESDIKIRPAQQAARVGDPAAHFLRALVIHCDIEDERNAAVKDTLEEIRTAAKTPTMALSDKQVRDLGHHLLGICQGWTRSFVRTSFWNSQATLAAVFVGIAVLAFGVGWWMHAPPTELACADQTDGSRICWMYAQLPTHK